MYDDPKVRDVHTHVGVPPVTTTYLAKSLAPNMAMASPLSGGLGHHVVGVKASEEQCRQDAAEHVSYIDERGIDVQIIEAPAVHVGWGASVCESVDSHQREAQEATRTA